VAVFVIDDILTEQFFVTNLYVIHPRCV